MKAPKLYSKKDGAYYFTFNGKQHYGSLSFEMRLSNLDSVDLTSPIADNTVMKERVA